MMDCAGCTACCRILLFPAEGTRMEKEFFNARGISIVSGAVVIPHRCPHLKENGCNIYNERPTACRMFRPGSEMCRLSRQVNKP